MSFREKISAFAENISIPVVITTICCIVIVASSYILGSYSLDVLVDNKFKDSMGLVFLDLSKSTERIEKNLLNRNRSIEKVLLSKEVLPDYSFKVEDGKWVQKRGTSISSEKLKEIIKFHGRFHIVKQVMGRNYTVKYKEFANGEKTLTLWQIPIAKWAAALANRDSTVYLVNMDGDILYSNNPVMSKKLLLQRENIQRFIASPLREQLIEFRTNDKRFYGFGAAIASSNIFLFVEVDKVFIARKVNEIVLDYVKTIGIVILIAIIVVLLLVDWVVSPVKELLRKLSQVAAGNFDVRILLKTFGELRILLKAFNFMVQGLKIRDTQIFELLEQQRSKLRMEMELDIAKDLQSNLLPEKADIDSCPGLEIKATYQAAGECAGDWYGVWYDPINKNSIVAIADVAGHGAGPSMFTAIIAAIFLENQNPSTGFSQEVFMERLNSVFMKIGKNQWHATLQLMIFNETSSQVELINAGHPFPAYLPGDESKKVKRITCGSQPIGIEQEMKAKHKKLKLNKGDHFVLYTDGILEGENSEKEQYGAKRFLKLVSSLRKHTPKGILEGIVTDWTAFREGTPAPDDICILSIRIK